ncbi:MAG TPA: glutamate-cysteine ligase family protein [Bacteriovoracaceae bacterium]|nr:glutamate-cysteine ligase family protein [Bacteriovoracaceae bacterium]
MSKGFQFGLEAEFMLASSEYKPLWYKDVSFNTLDSIFESISLEGIPNLAGLSAEPPHKKLMPFIVEGYGIADENFTVHDAYPKGIEIRTPVCGSIKETLSLYEDLYSRVKNALAPHGMIPVAISHHPVESKFSGPQNKRRHDFWLWAMEVMTTYGPDINVSFPPHITKELFSDLEDLNAKVNYYAPAMASISLSSPFLNGKPWKIKGEQGKSYRTYKRSVIAPAIELHPDENFRIEFKVFEMTRKVEDFEAYFLLVLSLFLDKGLLGRSTAQERIYDSGAVARFGIAAEGMKDRFVELYTRAPEVLLNYGFDPSPLKKLVNRIEKNETPSDEMLSIFEKENLTSVIKEFSCLIKRNGERI